MHLTDTRCYVHDNTERHSWPITIRFVLVRLQTMDSPITKKKSQKRKFCLGVKQTFPLKTFIWNYIFPEINVQLN